ncbi:MAG: class II aldolase/adducin family protein [Gammaproteobacteria bacterium]|nr:class II aldolase/adducin family protein [Gammaproteobacteria bacterium]
MKTDEGYIKFISDWTEGPAPERAATDLLDTWRRPLHRAGLIGHYADLGIGYGNISVRYGGPGQFIISCTQTGHLPTTTGEHYALVTACDMDENRVACVGPAEASSESLTHAALYQLDSEINAVVHVHSLRLWEELRGHVATTSVNVAYGTPQMAHEFARLYRDTDFPTSGIAVMAGHEEGIVSIGRTLEQAALRVLSIAAGPG